MLTLGSQTAETIKENKRNSSILLKRTLKRNIWNEVH